MDFDKNMEYDKDMAIPALNHFPKTTLIAVEFKDGVVVGSDSRTSSGTMVANRTTDKITPVTENIVVCRSGSAADTQAITDIVKYYVETYRSFS